MTRQERRARELAERRQVIVNAARELAESEGWESVTTRRLADRIEYSQPVLYSHFEGKDAIVTAVALEGYVELAHLLHGALQAAGSPEAEPRAVASAYLKFARENPAVYEAMFTLSVEMRFAQTDTPAPLSESFVEIRTAL
jgi:AcrR family transcriptional regulator